MTEMLVNLRDIAASDVARFGPKAANQALLGRAGLPIPEGFCLDVAAYQRQLESLGLLESAQNAATLTGIEARQLVSEVRIGLFDSPIVADVLDPLLEAWHELVSKTGARTVVRSSALSEDLADSSFAGQYETFLDIGNEEEFLTAIRACWAALWSPRALRYMESHKIDLADTAMGLCIQELIDARASGGGMSQSADGSVTLTATWGLGTTIAQGEVVPDRYILSRDGELLETFPGRTQHSAGCEHHPAVGKAATKSDIEDLGPCLSESQATELSGYMMRAEALMGQSVEIEWAQDEHGIRLLQARPLQMESSSALDETWSGHPGLRGQPSGTGSATGRACVINCECELSRVGPGDILVTKVASPSLSQVLPQVAGVVAELGGSTSHLASLARERGIPMVLGVLEATQKIPDGANIGIDGVMGMVRWQQ
jgi:pyruvate,water dikinase